MSENSENSPQTSISKARNYAQIAAYWDNHSLADVWDHTREVGFEVRVPRDRTLRMYSPHFVNCEDADEFVLEVSEEDSLDEDDDEERWNKAFAESADKLAKLADEALTELREGRTTPLDPDQL